MTKIKSSTPFLAALALVAAMGAPMVGCASPPEEESGTTDTADVGDVADVADDAAHEASLVDAANEAMVMCFAEVGSSLGCDFPSFCSCAANCSAGMTGDACRGSCAVWSGCWM